ncbi:phosphoglycerol transferase MdoB-like AlkP superfamily enzyme [Streptomyces sp. 2333.5]|uniref:sulfatase n=1 Tax=unclassified Streptomyces TaxID=2593676 RepID=UPI00089AA0FE|nr:MULTISPECIES: sulfatase [unclassified Streptomyces]PJJ04062.1 phosphoglycerol transferase MdoB-like AlkP superfamily enzyme [Streptomyces sp. 2333.5]SEE41171.1 Phosphoglycerol transferase MdoB [Streptomyces sp. 2314.4]SEE66888.1 Phosphoglycerol transferase MdoB [Streptomyces sp. 2112.2]
MSHTTSSRPLPQEERNTATEEDLPPDGLPEPAPNAAEATSDGGEATADAAEATPEQDTAASEGTGPEAATAPEAATETEAATDPEPDSAARPAPGWRDRHPIAARTLAWTTTALAGALVLVTLLLPNDPARLTPAEFVRIPVEGIAGAALLLVLPQTVRRVAAVLAGVGLALLAILDVLDIGFIGALGRGFNVVFDWPLLGDGASFLQDSIGPAGALGVETAAVVLVLALLVLTALAVVRLSNLMARHRATAAGTTLALGTAWVLCAALGLQIAGAPVASRSTSDLVQARMDAVSATLKDERDFAKQAATDPYHRTPGSQLLTGLRGKDVIFTFIESYGRSAVQDPLMAPGVDAVLAKGTKRLRAAGYSARSGWLTSATYGGGSWLGHSTFMSGLWIDNQQRYRTVTAGDHLTLTKAFQRTGAWRTVGIMPGVTKGWPEASWYGLDHVYDSRELGYKGPKFSWSTMPDQYSLSAFQRLEHGRPHDKPLMSEIILTSSHNPWAPLPKTLPWNKVGDGSVYNSVEKAGKNPVDVWQQTDRVRTEYGKSIQYSLNSLISYVEKYGNKNTVLVFLGDHQPVAKVSGDHASRDVPVALVAHDPDVLKRISNWHWTPSLNPGHQAPVWRMDTFRDRFLKAYGPHPDSATPPAAR